MVRLTVDGIPLEAADGSLLIDALSAAGKAVPHVCHDKRLTPSGACRLCLVQVQGQPRPVASCTAEVAEGMVVQTRSNALDALCRTNLELIAARYPRTAYAADPKHPFHRLLAEYGVPLAVSRRTDSSSRMTAIPTLASAWSAVSIASAVCASARRSRGSSSGRQPGAAMRCTSRSAKGRRYSPQAVSVAAPA